VFESDKIVGFDIKVSRKKVAANKSIRLFRFSEISPTSLIMKNDTYPGFEHKAKELSAYLFGSDMFTISLKDKRIIHHKVADNDAFRGWLDAHKVRDVNKE
jgi:hypothetical protein